MLSPFRLCMVEYRSHTDTLFRAFVALLKMLMFHHMGLSKNDFEFGSMTTKWSTKQIVRKDVGESPP